MREGRKKHFRLPGGMGGRERERERLCCWICTVRGRWKWGVQFRVNVALSVTRTVRYVWGRNEKTRQEEKKAEKDMHS